jgi:hydrogenase maturation protease
MRERPRKVLLIGYGNPGRMDDGLGPALAAEVEKLRLAGVTVDSDYQLTVEDAAAVAEHDVVVFADAAVDGPEPLRFERIDPKRAVSFSSHSVEPAAVLGLARDLFRARTPGYCLGIRGYEFNEYREQLSEGARANLAAAVSFIESVLRMSSFDEVAGRHERGPAVSCTASSGNGRCKTEST